MPFKSLRYRPGPALLLDVNALMALAWPNHQHHRAVVDRLDRPPAPEWATCALTQLGFVRLSSNPAVVGVRRTPARRSTCWRARRGRPGTAS